jgi:hypothetical protein
MLFRPSPAAQRRPPGFIEPCILIPYRYNRGLICYPEFREDVFRDWEITCDGAALRAE